MPAPLGQGPSLCLLTVVQTSSVFSQLPLWHCAQRMFASQTEGELKVTQVLKEKFPRATAIQVTDISGGCGAMYEIKIESEEFKEKRTVQQHQMVNQALKEEIKGMHGLRIFTSVPKC